MTLECLRSIVRETRAHAYEIIVVDNRSSDGSADAIASEFPHIQLIRSEENLGFARACNLAATLARGEMLLLLNPDTVVLDQAIDRLLEFAEAEPRAGIWGGRTLFADGSLNPTSCWGKMTLWSLVSMAVGLKVLFPKSEFFNSEGYGQWRPRHRPPRGHSHGLSSPDRARDVESPRRVQVRVLHVRRRSRPLPSRAKARCASDDHTELDHHPLRKRFGHVPPRQGRPRAGCPDNPRQAPLGSSIRRKVGEAVLLVQPLIRAAAYSAAAKLLRNPRMANSAHLWHRSGRAATNGSPDITPREPVGMTPRRTAKVVISSVVHALTTLRELTVRVAGSKPPGRFVVLYYHSVPAAQAPRFLDRWTDRSHRPSSECRPYWPPRGRRALCRHHVRRCPSQRFDERPP